jgi:hypothetical protein
MQGAMMERPATPTATETATATMVAMMPEGAMR